MASSSKPNPRSNNQKAKRKPLEKRTSSKLTKPYVPPKTKIREDDGLMRLNRYLAHAGIASRREADKLIELGLVTVNGKTIKELGAKVDPKVDVVKYDDRTLKPEVSRYVLLNKPKDYVTSSDDPMERRTVTMLILSACKERIYPVGKLDRNSTGLLLFTNDGDVAKRLLQPRFGFPKIYHVETVDKVTTAQLAQMREGIKLEDGYAKAEEAEYVGDGKDQHSIGVRINSDKSALVRRMFEQLGHKIKKLDRVMYAGLTKKDLPRGRYRHLTEQEVAFLKMIR
jgi:23S rRNA pseudouridine2605 synthase